MVNKRYENNELCYPDSDLVDPKQCGYEIILDERVGDNNLPIAPHIQAITEALYRNRVVVLKAPTGSGKSTQIAQHFASATKYDHKTDQSEPLFPGGIVDTQPRRLSASEVRAHAARQFGASLQVDGMQHIGLQHGYAKDLSPDNAITFMTEGILLNKIIYADSYHKAGKHVVILDEAHENTIEGDVNRALLSEQLRTDPNLYLLIMTATIEPQAIAADYTSHDQSVEVIDLDISTPFTIEHEVGENFLDTVQKYATTGLLGILPGVGEIAWATDETRKRLGEENEIEILPLHGDQTVEEQNRALAYNGKPRIIFATNIATTSLTPIGINTVVSSGVGRESVIDPQGQEKLVYKRTSQAGHIQIAGRVGRVTNGLSVQAPLPGVLGKLAKEQPLDYDTPSMLRSHLDAPLLRLASAGFDLEGLQLSHRPDYSAFKLARMRLERLQAFDSEGRVTDTGRAMAHLSLDPSLSRMVIAAERTADATVLQQMLAATAIQQAKGILQRNYTKDQTVPWLTMSDGEHHSNALQELDVLYELIAEDIQDKESLYKIGIIPRHLYNAIESYDKLRSRYNLESTPLKKPDDTQRQHLYGALIAGSVDGIFVKNDRKTAFKHGKHDNWQTDQNGAVPSSAKIVVGQPIGIEMASPEGFSTKWIINGATHVTFKQLQENIPDRLSQHGMQRFRLVEGGNLEEWTKILVDNNHTGLESLRPVTEQNASVRQFLARQATHFGVMADITSQIDDLLDRNPHLRISKDMIHNQIESGMPREVINLHSLGDYLRKVAGEKTIGIGKIISEDELQAITEKTPPEITIGKTTYSVTYHKGVARIVNCDPSDHRIIVEAFDVLGTDVDITDKRPATNRNGRRSRHQSSRKK